MKEEILQEITAILPKTVLIKIENTSLKHKGHLGFKEESHFEVIITNFSSNVFEKIKMQKTLTSALAKFYSREKVHSISIIFN